MPPPSPVSALTRDVARIIDTQEQLGWFIDELELEAALPDALMSACRVTAATRQGALRWLDARVEALGGDPGAAWQARGEDLDAVAELLLYHRTRALLRRADDWARRGRCPFWLKPQADFKGQQAAAGRVFFAAETGGRAYAQWGREGQGGGGELRLLLGKGQSAAVTTLTGLEIGGMGLFRGVTLGERLGAPDIIVTAAAPLTLRLHGLSRHLDLEAAPLVYVDQLEAKARWGGRVAVGVGLSYLRLRWVLPTLTFALTFDALPKALNEEAVGVYRLGAGLRAGFQLLP